MESRINISLIIRNIAYDLSIYIHNKISDQISILINSLNIKISNEYYLYDMTNNIIINKEDCFYHYYDSQNSIIKLVEVNIDED